MVRLLYVQDGGAWLIVRTRGKTEEWPGNWTHVPDAPSEGIARPLSECSFSEETAVYKVYLVEPVVSQP